MRDRQEQQLTLWEYISPRFKLTQPVILLEMFAGIGAQHKALSILGVEIDKEKSKICEWAYNSYCGYNAIHIKDKTDYSQGKTKEQLIERINGTSMNYNEPLTMDQLKKKPIEWVRNAYNNCVATHNLINIMSVKGSDLGELPKNKTSILTYSFPCQDLSLAGKRQGMATSQADGGTRSGLLWEIERILTERERDNSTLPTILLMENVPEVVGSGNIQHFKKWEQRLREFGYSNFVDILNGKDYGIPQNRRRCFMISILGDYSYDFPCKVPLKYRLKDLLETNVDEKYYLSQKLVDFFTYNSSKQKESGNGFDFHPFAENETQEKVAKSITTRAGSRMDDNFISNARLGETLDNKEINNGDFIDTYNRSVSSDISGTITTRISASNNHFIGETDKPIKVGNYGNGHHAKDVIDTAGVMATITTGNHNLGQTILIKNNNEKGFLEAESGDGINICGRMEYQRGNVQKGSSQTLSCRGGNDVGVVVENEKYKT